MKLKLFIFSLCLLAFGATMVAQPSTVPVTAKQIKTVVVKGITYTTAKPIATVESLTKNCTKTGEMIEIDEVITDVWQSKPTNKYPDGRIFLVHKTKKGTLSRMYLR